MHCQKTDVDPKEYWIQKVDDSTLDNLRSLADSWEKRKYDPEFLVKSDKISLYGMLEALVYFYYCCRWEKDDSESGEPAIEDAAGTQIISRS